MTQDIILDLARNALWTIISVAAPPLLCGLAVGLIVSIFQTVTSIQEATLAFVPKILAVLFAILFFGSFMLTTLMDYITNLYQMIPQLIVPR